MLECAGARGFADLPVAGRHGGRSPVTRSGGAPGPRGRPRRRNARTGRPHPGGRPVPVLYHIVRPTALHQAGQQGAHLPRSAAAQAPCGSRARTATIPHRATASPRPRLRAPHRARGGPRRSGCAHRASSLWSRGFLWENARNGATVGPVGARRWVESAIEGRTMRWGSASRAVSRDLRPPGTFLPAHSRRKGGNPPQVHPSTSRARQPTAGGAHYERVRLPEAAAPRGPWWIPPQLFRASPDGPAAPARVFIIRRCEIPGPARGR